MQYIFKIAACAAVFSLAAAPTFAQFSFFQPQGSGADTKKRSGKAPTVINSDSMDLDIGKNTAVFTGNVNVDDEEMTITCKKMTIYLEDKKPDPSLKPGEAKPEEGKQVSRIICEEDVVIIRKPSSDKEKSEGEQRATAGHSDYDVKTGKVVLTKDPVLMRNDDVLKGEVIVFWRDSEKVEVTGKSEMRMTSDAPGAEPKQENETVKPPEDKGDRKTPQDKAQKNK